MSSEDNNTTAPWPSMRGNAQNTGCWQFGAPIDVAQVRWGLARTDGVPPGILNATPVVGPGEVVYVGSSDGRFYRMAPQTEPLQSSDIGAPVDSAACFTDRGRLFLPAGDFQLHGGIPGGSGYQGFPMRPQASPSTINWLEGNVVTNGGGRLFAGCDNFYFYACQDMSEGDGTQLEDRWSFATGFFIWSAAGFTRDNKVGCFASADMTVYGFRPQSERADICWTSRLQNLCASSPAITSDGRVMLGAFDGRVYALFADSGTQYATCDTGALIYASPALYEGDAERRLFVLASNGVLHAYDITHSFGSPVLQWTFFTGMPAFSSPVVGPDPDDAQGWLVYVASGDGVVMAVERNGRLRGRFDVAALPGGSVAAADPAFWPSLRYPAINASLALSRRGVVAVTSGGVVACIPYNRFSAAQGHAPGASSAAEATDAPPPPRFRYVSPSGRMASSDLGAGAATMPIDRGQMLTFAALDSMGFRSLARDTVVASVDGTPQEFQMSADGTMLYFPAPVQDQPFTLKLSVAGMPCAPTRCEPRPIQQPWPVAKLQGASWLVSGMSIVSPFVVPALDQLAIATIRIHLRILQVTPIQGTTDRAEVMAYGCEHYDEGAAGGASRDLLYVFRGTYQGGFLQLEARNCYFELSAIPITLDSFRLSAVLDGEDPRALSLVAQYQPRDSTTFEWLYNWLTKWRKSVATASPAPAAADGTPTVWERIEQFAGRLLVLREQLLAPWKLFDANGAFFWSGTYSLDRAPLPSHLPPQLQQARCEGDTVVMVIALSHDIPADRSLPAGGILLFDNTTAGALLELPYTLLNEDPERNGRLVTYRMSLLDPSIDRRHALVARVMFNAQQAIGEYALPPKTP